MAPPVSKDNGLSISPSFSLWAIRAGIDPCQAGRTVAMINIRKYFNAINKYSKICLNASGKKIRPRYMDEITDMNINANIIFKCFLYL